MKGFSLTSIPEVICGGLYVYQTSSILNTIVYNNYQGSTPSDYSHAANATSYWSYSCTAPLPAGAGNTNVAPGFVNFAGDDFHLTPQSPCINKGLNQEWMNSAVDLDGHRRLNGMSGPVDMGCYEYVFAGTLILIQ